MGETGMVKISLPWANVNGDGLRGGKWGAFGIGT